MFEVVDIGGVSCNLYLAVKSEKLSSHVGAPALFFFLLSLSLSLSIVKAQGGQKVPDLCLGRGSGAG